MTGEELAVYCQTLAAGQNARALTRRQRAVAPKWRVRTCDPYGRWTCRYVCLTPAAALERYRQLIDAGWSHVDVVPPEEEFPWNM